MRLLTPTGGFLGASVLGHAGVYTATSWIAEMFAEAGHDVVRVGFGSGGTARVVGPTEATAMLVAGDVDAVYSQYVDGGIAFDLAGLSPRTIPVVSIGHDLYNGMAPLCSYLTSTARHPADAVVFSSDAGARAFRKMVDICGVGETADVDVFVLPLGVSLPENDGREECSGEHVTFLWLGRFSDTYKADLRPLLLAFRDLLAHRGPDTRLVLMGADVSNSVERLRGYADGLGIASYCAWYPNASAVERDEWLRRADVLVNVSDHVQETFGLVNLEAMARGLPVIASSWSGFREIVSERTGRLVPTALEPAVLQYGVADPHGSASLAATVDIPALTDAMKQLRDHRRLRHQLGAAGRRRVEEVYSTGVLAPKYVAFFEERIARAAEGEARENPRSWMPHAFAHYGARGRGKLEIGTTDLGVALELVPSDQLRHAMRALCARSLNGESSTRAGDLDAVAFATLLKLGVLRWKEVQG